MAGVMDAGTLIPGGAEPSTCRVGQFGTGSFLIKEEEREEGPKKLPGK